MLGDPLHDKWDWIISTPVVVVLSLVHEDLIVFLCFCIDARLVFVQLRWCLPTSMQEWGVVQIYAETAPGARARHTGDVAR